MSWTDVPSKMLAPKRTVCWRTGNGGAQLFHAERAVRVHAQEVIVLEVHQREEQRFAGRHRAGTVHNARAKHAGQKPDRAGLPFGAELAGGFQEWIAVDRDGECP